MNFVNPHRKNATFCLISYTHYRVKISIFKMNRKNVLQKAKMSSITSAEKNQSKSIRSSSTPAAFLGHN